MEFKTVKYYPLLDLGLSQIYLNADRILAIEKWFVPDDMSIFEPLPVHDFGNGKYTLTDGHSRAYVAYKNGITHIPIVYDLDDIVVGEKGQMLYRADIEWCKRFHIENISHLEKRILTGEQYQKLWMERCDKSYYLLTQTTEKEREQLQSIEPEYFLYGASEELTELYFENREGKIYEKTNYKKRI